MMGVSTNCYMVVGHQLFNFSNQLSDWYPFG